MLGRFRTATGISAMLVATFVLSLTLAGEPPAPSAPSPPPESPLGLRGDLALLFTKDCPAADPECLTVPLDQRSPRLAVLRRTPEGWVVAQLHAATYGIEEGEKWQEGDLKTPEGLYHTMGAMVRRDADAKWGGGQIHLSYPNREDVETKQPRPGGGIYIHGGLPRRTLGCTRVLDGDAVRGAIHQVGIQQVIASLGGGEGGQAPVIQVPYYPERCLPAAGEALPPACGGALDYVLAHAGALLNRQVVGIVALLEPIPDSAPAPSARPAAPPPPEPKNCQPSPEELAAMSDLPLRVVGDVVEFEVLGSVVQYPLPPEGTPTPLLGLGTLTYVNCDRTPDAAVCLAPPPAVASSEALVLRRGERTQLISGMGNGEFGPDGGSLFTPFGVGTMGSEGVVVDTPSGPIEIPREFEVMEVAPPRALGGEGWCDGGEPCPAADVAFDDSYLTAWCGGPGDSLVIPYEATSLVATLTLFNGAHSARFFELLNSGEQEAANELWGTVGRVKRLRVGEGADTTVLDLNDAFGEQVLPAGERGVCARELTVTIEEVIPPSSDPDAPGCLSELSVLFGNRAGD